jgi:hypothetical protein
VTLPALEAMTRAPGDKFTDFANTIANLYFLDEGAVSLSQIKSECRALMEHIPPRTLGGLVVDHAGLVKPERGIGSGAYERASATAVGLKQNEIDEREARDVA